MLEIFIISFLVALSGALSPGPLLTFTIFKSIQHQRGYLEGLLILSGHALLEMALITVLLLGASILLQNTLVLLSIGLFGSCLLILFGILTIKNTLTQPLDFEPDYLQNNPKNSNFKGNSFIGGIWVSLSNPYWTLWWAVIGLSLMLSFDVGFHNPIGILLFFLGHELGDFIWYFPISLLVCYGGKFINSKMYNYILIGCGFFMIFFGGYLFFRILLFPPI